MELREEVVGWTVTVSVASLGSGSCSSGILDRLWPLEGGLVFGTKRLFVSSAGGSHGYRLGIERDISADTALPHGRPYSGVTVTLIRFGQQNKIASKIVLARLRVLLSYLCSSLRMYAGMKPW